jgi:hypothetical protein
MSLAELVQHRLRVPGRELLDDLDAEGMRGIGGARLPREGRAVARVAAHLHVHGHAGAERAGRCRLGGLRAAGYAKGDQPTSRQ